MIGIIVAIVIIVVIVILGTSSFQQTSPARDKGSRERGTAQEVTLSLLKVILSDFMVGSPFAVPHFPGHCTPRPLRRGDDSLGPKQQQQQQGQFWPTTRDMQKGRRREPRWSLCSQVLSWSLGVVVGGGWCLLVARWGWFAALC